MSANLFSHDNNIFNTINCDIFSRDLSSLADSKMCESNTHMHRFAVRVEGCVGFQYACANPSSWRTACCMLHRPQLARAQPCGLSKLAKLLANAFLQTVHTILDLWMWVRTCCTQLSRRENVLSQTGQVCSPFAVLFLSFMFLWPRVLPG